MHNFTLPIYWVETFKTKPNKTHLVGMNFYRNAHFIQQNKLKKDLEELLYNSNTVCSKIEGSFTVSYVLFYKNSACDASNIIALIEKIFLDFAQAANIIQQDSVKYHLGSSWSIGGQDKSNPRVEITIKDLNATYGN